MAIHMLPVTATPSEGEKARADSILRLFPFFGPPFVRFTARPQSHPERQ